MPTHISRLNAIMEKSTLLLAYIVRTAKAAAIPNENFAGDEFSNNLFSDLAPLLTLFGEQVTRQYQAQSLGWADNIIFACAPLGIITAVVGAIRIAGPNWLRAVVGRAREGDGVAESEIMSSTSESVCELWSGRSIVRLLGSPDLLELVYVPYNQNREGSLHEVAVFDLAEAVNNDHLHASNGSREALGVMLTRKDPPNLSLSVEGALCGKIELWTFAVIGIIIQSAVIAYSIVAVQFLQLPKGGSRVSGYALPCTLIGMLLIVGGLLICSHVIEGTTTEVTLGPPTDDNLRVIRIQRGGQKVNDQVFKAYAFLESTSHQNQHQESGTNMTRRVMMSRKLSEKTPKKFELLTILGSFGTIIGFVVQFVGLRAMHWSATIILLGATLIMTAIRSWVRRGLSKDPRPKEIPEGRELDWLAKEICGNAKWDVKSMVDCEELFRLQRDANTINTSIGAKVVEIRAHLGTITGWHTVNNAARGLKMALDGAMEHICGSDDFQINRTIIRSPNRSPFYRGDGMERFEWGICIEIGGEPTMLRVSMERQVTEDGNVDGNERYGPWNTNQEDLEAILSLWMGSLRERNDQLETNRETLNQEIPANSERPPVSNLYWKDYVTVVGHADQQFNSIYKSWISRGMELVAVKTDASKEIARLSVLPPDFNLSVGYDGREEGEISARVLIGCPYHGDRTKDESASVLSGSGGDDVLLCQINPTSRIEEACARDIFAKFMYFVPNLITSIGGTTVAIPPPVLIDTPVERGYDTTRMRNSALSGLVESVRRSGIFTEEEALIAIIPPIWAANKLPKLGEKSKESVFMEEWLKKSH